MAKGSQLSQLKSALAKADLSRTSHSKKRKSASAQPRDKNERTAKIQEIHEKLNPFDLKVTKLKHDVGGRKIKGAVGRPLVSRQAGLEKVRLNGHLLLNSTNLLAEKENSARRI